jgi:hypothetical protein
VETCVALRLEVDLWRWQGVPESLLEPKNDSGTESEVGLVVGTSVGELGVQPIGVQGAQGEMGGHGHVHASTDQNSEAVGAVVDSRGAGKDAVKTIDLAGQSLGEDRDAVSHRSPGIARAEGCGHQIEPYSLETDMAGMRAISATTPNPR